MNQSQDEDGVIDLRGLKLAPVRWDAGAPAERPPLPPREYASPFASEPPPAYARDATAEKSGSSRRKVVGIAFAMITLIIVGGFGAKFTLEARAARAQLAAAAAAPPKPTAASPLPPASSASSVAAAANAPTAATSATTTTDDNTTGDDAGTSAGKVKKSKTRKSRGVRPSKEKEKPAAAKPSDPCQCNGDLQCSMRCAAGK
jgi:hypothetical protein